VSEPRTHYQASFTGKQALGLFVGLLLALGIAYFLGVMTGLAGRGESEDVAAAEPVATEAPAEAFPTPVLGIQPKGPGRVLVPPDRGAAAASESAPRGNIQLFEDRAEGERPQTASPSGGPPAAGFWVQVVSLSSEREAQVRSSRLSSRGYKATVSPASGPRGTLYRVRVGPFVTREEAANAAQRLSVEEKAETWIVPAR
jgi:cell division septation protein DedD